MIDAEKIINKWIEFTNFDEDRRQFNLNSWEYTFHRYNEKISKLTKAYNLPTYLTIVYIKNLFYWFTKECKIRVADILEPDDCLNNIMELNILFKNEEIKNFENKLYQMLNNISISLAKDKILIGEMDLSKMVESTLDTIFDELLKCQFEIYQIGKPIGKIDYICKNIFMFNTLVEALPVLSAKPDGLYVCYISNHNTADNYFGFFIKNNGNLFSINERMPEAFIGQHVNGRNNRFLDSKPTSLFPYELLQVKDRDYLGYAKNYILKNDKKDISLNDLTEESYINLLMVILLIKLRFEGKPIEGDIVYSNLALSNNIKQLIADENSLMVLSNDLIIRSQDEKLNDIIAQFTTENILSGEFNTHFTSENKDLTYHEYGYFENNLFIDLYGKNFKFKPELILIDDTLKLLTSGKEDSIIHAEFVGNEKELSLQIYNEARKQLGNHIQENMNKEYEKFKNNFGSVQKWYDLVLNKYRSKIIKWVVQQYVNKKHKNNFINGDWRSCDDSISIGYDEGDWSSTYGCRYPFNELGSKCFINGKTTNCVITVKVSNYKDIEHILGQEVPKIIKGWQYTRNTPNSLLNVVDPIIDLQTPFESRGSFCYNPDLFSFTFAIKFSKSGLKKYIKEHNIVPEIQGG